MSVHVYFFSHQLRIDQKKIISQAQIITHQKMETEGTYSDHAETLSVPGIEESVSIQAENRGRLEFKKKLKKVRSIRLVRLSSMRSSTREGKAQYGTESLEIPIEMGDASPNYMKGTSSSHAKDSFQNTQRLLITKKTMTRMSTLKLKRSLTRKLSGRTEPKRKLKSSRSIKLATFQGPKSTKYPSESIHGSDGQSCKRANITRRLSFKPVRILTKMPTFKSKRSSKVKECKISESQDSSLHRATCSSTLKDSHFPDHIDIPQEESASQGVPPAVKVCSYSYCSLHGHRHGGNLPPLKRFVSMRRRVLKTQKSMKMDGQHVTRSKQSSNAKKATQKTQNVHSEVTSGKNVEPDCEVLQKSSSQKEPTPDSTTDVACGKQERDKKFVKMWQLMYKHAVLSNTGKGENKLNMEGREKDSLAIDASKSSCHDDCEKDQGTDDENKNVVELVQRAFDEILLPEPEDIFSDDHSKSDEEHLENNEGKIERKISTSSKSPKEEQKMETKSDQRVPKSWSNLKKLILLRRFVKALEKVRNINLRSPRHLPSDANLEMEKVHLKHQTAEEKKNAEEWMLDYALQRVISELAPAQRRRVNLLVEAFETILPFQDAENSPQSFLMAEAQENPIQSLNNSSNLGKEEASFSPNSTMEVAYIFGGDDPMPELHNPIMLKERCLDFPGTGPIKKMPASGAIEEDLNCKKNLACCYDYEEKISTENDNIYQSSTSNKPVKIISKCHEEGSTNETVNEVPEDLIFNADTENPNIKSESPGRDVGAKNPVGDKGEQFCKSKNLLLEGLVRSLRSNLVGSGALEKQLDDPAEDIKEKNGNAKLEAETLEEFSTQESQTPVEKQNYAGLWCLVYKHMVSNVDENKSKSLIDGEDEKEPGYDGSRPGAASISDETSTSVANQDMKFKDVEADPEVEKQQIEAIKMVEEAIDSIFPDDQDDLPGKKSLIDNTICGRVHSEGLNQKEEKVESGKGIVHEEEEESAPKKGDKTNQQMPRSWSNLKKVILIRRFIKSLEKVRKFNPRGPRYLPVEPGSEDEKVLLRHQDVDERKGTEEWMLDYALRQAVSKLTPARKRKVELLVEAFETVMPTIKN
ncbi:hypothetical protein RJT34_18805 [Clitoria ternatea]|uniref:Calmodulin-binding domain-containing protein n=1 Tax=Clitoria ternatea TaxID=43366 RepID=A0AAN9IQ83_CLITE